MSKHTPGPWIVRDDEIQDVHGNTIAYITEGGYWNTTAGMIYEDMPWEANAHLMAAAPEMFECLDAIMGFDSKANYRARRRAYDLLKELKKP